MRFSNFLLPLAFLLSIGSVCAEHLLTGVWSMRQLNGQYLSPYCCAPVTLKIEETGNNMLNATFQYYWANSDSAVDGRCNKVFQTLGRDNPKGYLGIYNFTTASREKYISEAISTPWGGLELSFEVYERGYKKEPALLVFSKYQDSSMGCNYSMTVRQDFPKPSTGTPVGNYEPIKTEGSTGVVVIVVWVLIIIALCAVVIFKGNQKKQANAIMAQNTQANVSFDYNAAPNMQVHQQYDQPQANYTAPNQFPNTQVNMNFGGNNGGFQAQAKFN